MKYIKVLFLLLATVLLPLTISADQPTRGTGTFTAASPPTILDTRVADGNTIVTAMQPFTVVGTWTGTEVLTFHEVIHPNGTVNIESFGVFTGTVNGIAGNLPTEHGSTRRKVTTFSVVPMVTTPRARLSFEGHLFRSFH